MPQCDCKAPSVMNLISVGRTRHWLQVACTVNRDRRLFVCMLLPLWCRDIRQSVHNTTKRPVGSLFCFLLSWSHKHFVVHLFFCVILGSPSFYAAFQLAGSKRRSHYDLVILNASLRHLCFGFTFQATNLFLSSVTAQGVFSVCQLQTFVPQISGDHCFLRHVGVSVDSWGSVCKQLWVFC